MSQTGETGIVDTRAPCFAAFEYIKDGICVFDASWRCLYTNTALQRLTGYDAQALAQLSAPDLLPTMLTDLPPPVSTHEATRLLCRDGREMSLSASLSPLGETCHLVVVHDDTALTRLNRAHRMVRACGKALVDACNEQQLLTEICDLVVSIGGYRMAWVGLAQHDPQRSVLLAAQAGRSDGYLSALRLNWGDTQLGRGPTGTAIRLGLTQVNQDFVHNPHMAPWRAAALACGFQSSIALPLGPQSARLGALTIYATEPNGFCEPEVALLEELARDIGYGMTALRTRVEHDQISVDKRVLEARFNYLSKLVNDIMLLIDVGGRILEANERAEEAYGYAHAELLRMNADDLLAPQTVDVFKPETPSAPHRLETLHRRRDGTVFPVEKHERLIELEGRKILQVILRDLTENRRVEAALAASEARYRSLFENMIEGFAYCQMLYLDGVAQDYLVLEVNTSFERLTGLGNVSGRKGSELIAGVPGVAPERLRVYERVATTGQPERFETFVDSLGIWFAVTVYSPGSGYFIMVFDNITDRKDADARIHFLAHHDALTGLPNRMLGRTRFEMARAYSDQSHNKVALLFLDLDNFKTVNDSLGHTLGDKLLMAVAQRLRECVRETDVICRQGGDEFLLVLLDMPDGESIDLLAAKLLKQVAASYRIDGIDLSISASCGVAIYPNDGQDFDTLYKKADAAMYQAKESGRNACRFYDEQMNLGADERLNLGASLRQALELQEFTLYFQPQIDLGSRMIIGAEALIRWNHPQLGLVPPGRFIPVAENSWQIVPICEWVLNEACRQAQWWRLQGLPDLVVAVNLSAVQFRRGTLEQIVAAALRDSGLPSHLLELELTETILIKDTEKALATVRHLKNLGVKLSIDDFGTGYSSLAYLQRFTVDKVKIDQSFIADLTDDPSNVAIVKAIIQMAKSLGLRTIAEGVEVGWMLDYLAINQCDEAQGYHIGAPMPTDRFVDFVKGKWASSNDSAAR